MAQKRCPYCGKWFKAAPRKWSRQVTCGATECRRQHKRMLERVWRAKDPVWTQCRRQKVREWAQREGYWKKNLLKNPKYVERNRQQTRERMRRLRDERKNSREVMRDSLGYLRGLRGACGEDVCKPGTGGAFSSTGGGPTAEDVCKTRTGGGAVVGVVRYLIAREVFAKQEGLAVTGGPGV